MISTFVFCEECLESNHMGIFSNNKEYLPPSHDVNPAHYSGDEQEWHSIIVVSHMAVWTLLLKSGT